MSAEERSKLTPGITTRSKVTRDSKRGDFLLKEQVFPESQARRWLCEDDETSFLRLAGN